ncbi:MAG TPA: HlyD family secretion protein [Myxococcota bacterium]|jgi:membrane fusion protein (multidrug efflux system)
MSAAPSTSPSERAPLAAAPPQASPPKKSRARIVLPVLLVLVLAGGGLRYWFTYGKESTDDAQIEGRIVSVAARVPGSVTKVLVQDNQLVHAGDVLVQLDDAELKARLEVASADAESAAAQLAAAQAQYGLTERSAWAGLKQAQGGLAQASSTLDSSKAGVDQARADVVAAEARLKLADADFARVKHLFDEHAAAQSELDARQAALDQAKAGLDQSNARLSGTKASIDGSAGGLVFAQGRLQAASTAPQQVANAKAAIDLATARVDQTQAAQHLAELNLSYAQVRASVDGVVSRRSVEVGQLVSPERPLMALVPPSDVWVVANFKEDQIGDMKPGQLAHIKLDTYGSREFLARVDSIAGASGARFSLLPPDNASGNYVKVVQRVPVLLRFDPLPDVPLRPGLSADVVVDVKAAPTAAGAPAERSETRR